jgi:hypothetical protein
VIIIPLCLAPILFILGSCSAEKSTQEDIQAEPKSFTFFDVGSNTRYSDRLRHQLRKALGTDAIERRSTINLEIEPKGFLAQYFPKLDQINSQLNFRLGERTFHKTIKLMYRYTFKKNLPFTYVEYIFSGYTQKPLLISIDSKQDLAEIQQTIERKYGPPQTIQLNADRHKIHYWQNEQDLFLMSIAPDRHGRLEYRIRIYYGDNLSALAKTEEAERNQKEKKRRQAEKTAF